MKTMCRLILVAICLLVVSHVKAQNDFKRFQLEFGYGLSISGDFKKNDNQGFPDLKFRTPIVGKNMEVSGKYFFKNNRFIGLGFNVQSYVEILNGIDNIGGELINYEDYRLEEEIQYYELHYGKFFNNGLDFTMSLSWISYYQPIISNEFFNGESALELRHPEKRSDDFGLALAIGYRIYENDAINISLRLKIPVSFNGLEAITFTPLVRFNF